MPPSPGRSTSRHAPRRGGGRGSSAGASGPGVSRTSRPSRASWPAALHLARQRGRIAPQRGQALRPLRVRRGQEPRRSASACSPVPPPLVGSMTVRSPRQGRVGQPPVDRRRSTSIAGEMPPSRPRRGRSCALWHGAHARRAAHHHVARRRTGRCARGRWARRCATTGAPTAQARCSGPVSAGHHEPRAARQLHAVPGAWSGTRGARCRADAATTRVGQASSPGPQRHERRSPRSRTPRATAPERSPAATACSPSRRRGSGSRRSVPAAASAGCASRTAARPPRREAGTRARPPPRCPAAAAARGSCRSRATSGVSARVSSRSTRRAGLAPPAPARSRRRGPRRRSAPRRPTSTGPGSRARRRSARPAASRSDAERAPSRERARAAAPGRPGSDERVACTQRHARAAPRPSPTSQPAPVQGGQRPAACARRRRSPTAGRTSAFTRADPSRAGWRVSWSLGSPTMATRPP